MDVLIFLFKLESLCKKNYYLSYSVLEDAVKKPDVYIGSETFIYVRETFTYEPTN